MTLRQNEITGEIEWACDNPNCNSSTRALIGKGLPDRWKAFQVDDDPLIKNACSESCEGMVRAGDNPGECACCQYETTALELYPANAMGQHGASWLCEICASTYIANMWDYPKLYDHHSIILGQAIAWVGNRLLDELRKGNTDVLSYHLPTLTFLQKPDVPFWRKLISQARDKMGRRQS
jgi:hypothetical protein